MGQGNVRRRHLKSNQVQAAMEILAGARTNAEIAGRAGVTHRALNLWMNDERFKRFIDELADERAEACRKAIGEIVYLSARRLLEMVIDPASDLRGMELIQAIDRLERFMPADPTPSQEQQAALQMLQQLEHSTAGVPAVAGQDLWTQVNQRLVAVGREETNGVR